MGVFLETYGYKTDAPTGVGTGVECLLFYAIYRTSNDVQRCKLSKIDSIQPSPSPYVGSGVWGIGEDCGVSPEYVIHHIQELCCLQES